MLTELFVLQLAMMCRRQLLQVTSAYEGSTQWAKGACRATCTLPDSIGETHICRLATNQEQPGVGRALRVHRHREAAQRCTNLARCRVRAIKDYTLYVMKGSVRNFAQGCMIASTTTTGTNPAAPVRMSSGSPMQLQMGCRTGPVHQNANVRL